MQILSNLKGLDKNTNYYGLYSDHKLIMIMTTKVDQKSRKWVDQINKQAGSELCQAQYKLGLAISALAN